MSLLIFRVVPLAEWRQAQGAGRVARCGADIRSGFIHLSTASTLLETANLYFDAEGEPIALEVSEDSLGDSIKWETVTSRGGEAFPHLYAEAIPVSAVIAWYRLEAQPDGRFSLGDRHPIAGEATGG